MSADTTHSPAPDLAAVGPGRVAPVQPGRVRRRRRPVLFALMAALVAAGALLAAYAYSSIDNTQAVLVVAQDVPAGAVIGAGDVRVVRLSVDPALTPVTEDARAEVVGRRAAVDLLAGTMLTANQVTDHLVPAVGQSLVGVSLTASQMPAEPLAAGDAVRIVATRDDQAPAGGQAPVTFTATVVDVAFDEVSGQTVVDVSVPQDQSADLAARAAAGRVALILDSRER